MAFLVVTLRVNVGDKQLFSRLNRRLGDDRNARECTVLIEMAHGDVGRTHVIEMGVKRVEPPVRFKIYAVPSATGISGDKGHRAH